MFFFLRNGCSATYRNCSARPSAHSYMMWKKMLRSFVHATLPKTEPMPIKRASICIQNAASPSSLSLHTSDRTSMSTPLRSSCAFLLIFFCLWNLATGECNHRKKRRKSRSEKGPTRHIAKLFTVNNKLLDAFQPGIFIKCIDNIVEHIENSWCMGAEPNRALLGQKSRYSYLEWSSRSSATHSETRQRDVFECGELLLVLGESLEESEENMLGRVQALRGLSIKNWKQIHSNHTDWMYISALTFALGIFHVSLIICTSAVVSSTMGGVGTSLSEVEAILWRKLPIAEIHFFVDWRLRRPDEEWTHVPNERSELSWKCKYQAPWLVFTNTIARRAIERKKSIRWTSHYSSHRSHFYLTSPKSVFFEKKLNHRANVKLALGSSIQRFYGALSYNQTQNWSFNWAFRRFF